jgi:hypothetical protein
MSEEGKIYEFDANELVQEMQFVMRKGLSKMLANFLSRHELLEKTHKQIMLLPSVLNELNRSVPEEKPESNNDNNTNKDVEQLHSKINALENKLDTGISTILNIVQELSKEIQQNKEKIAAAKPKIQSSIFASCENENIKVEVEAEESDEEEDVLSEKEEEEDDEEEEEVEEEEEEEVEEEEVVE